MEVTCVPLGRPSQTHITSGTRSTGWEPPAYTYHTSWFGQDCPGLNVSPSVPSQQNVLEFHFGKIFEVKFFKMNSRLMMHCYEIIPLNGHLFVKLGVYVFNGLQQPLQ